MLSRNVVGAVGVDAPSVALLELGSFHGAFVQDLVARERVVFVMQLAVPVAHGVGFLLSHLAVAR